MPDAIARLARSDDWTERVRAAHVLAWSDVVEREEIGRASCRERVFSSV